MNRDYRVANYLVIILSVASLVLLSLPLSGKVRAFRGLAAYLLDPIPYFGAEAIEKLAGLPEGAARLIEGDVELLKARRRLREAELLRLEVEALRSENERLRLAAGLEPPAGRIVRWAQIIQRDPSNWQRSLKIGVGSDGGVELNAPVLGLQEGRLGVVGRITEVSNRTATVLLLTDEISSLAAQMEIGGWEGLVQGQGSSRLRMNYLPMEAEFRVGDSVRASATSAAFPTGLPIGRVSRVFAPDPFLTFQSVELEPMVSAAALEEVLILEPVLAKFQDVSSSTAPSSTELRRGGGGSIPRR